jgi:hypothetical protein
VVVDCLRMLLTNSPIPWSRDRCQRSDGRRSRGPVIPHAYKELDVLQERPAEPDVSIPYSHIA